LAHPEKAPTVAPIIFICGRRPVNHWLDCSCAQLDAEVVRVDIKAARITVSAWAVVGAATTTGSY